MDLWIVWINKPFYFNVYRLNRCYHVDVYPRALMKAKLELFCISDNLSQKQTYFSMFTFPECL